MIFQRMILVYTVMFLISLLMLICTQNVWSHEVSQSTAQKALYIPELKLYSKPLIVSGNAHLHIGSVSQPSKPGGGRYTCNPIPESRLNKVADLIQATLKQNKIKTYMGLEYLIVCGEVTANGQKIGGIPVPPLHLLMLSMVNQTDESVAHLFWHEFFHYLELQVYSSY